MDFKSYIGQELEKLLFIEINKDLTLNLKGNPTLKSGEYPIIYESVVNLAKNSMDGIAASDLIDGMIYIIACDPSFKFNHIYINFLKSVEGIVSYIIMNIEKYKNSDIKKSIIYSTALETINPDKRFSINRVMLLMDLHEKTGSQYVEEEILSSLIKIAKEHPNDALPNYYLGEYYLNKDMDRAKYHLRKCSDDSTIRSEAIELLERIENIEGYDRAVELVKEGSGYEALQTLIPYIEDNPNSLDGIYYTAVALRQTENYHKAFLYLNELLDLGGERAEVYCEMGINLAALNDFEEALEYFKKALKITPDDSGIISNIAVCHLNLGEIEEAKEAFELASRINPRDEIVKEWLVKLKEV